MSVCVHNLLRSVLTHKNEDKIKNKGDLKNEDHLKNENNLKNEDNLKKIMDII